MFTSHTRASPHCPYCLQHANVVERGRGLRVCNDQIETDHISHLILHTDSLFLHWAYQVYSLLLYIMTLQINTVGVKIISNVSSVLYVVHWLHSGAAFRWTICKTHLAQLSIYSDLFWRLATKCWLNRQRICWHVSRQSGIATTCSHTCFWTVDQATDGGSQVVSYVRSIQ